MNPIKKLFSKMIRRKMVYTYFKQVKINQTFHYEGRKFIKLDKERAYSPVFPVLRMFDPSTIVIAVYY